MRVPFSGYVFRSCSVPDLVAIWSRSGSALVLFLGLLGLRGRGPYLVLYWVRSYSVLDPIL